MIEVRPLPRDARRAAARMYAEAFVDDPGWSDTGPESRRRRWHFCRRVCGGEVRAAPGAGGKVLATFDGGEPSAAVVFYPPEVKSSLRLLAAVAPGAALAGPGVVRRGLASQSVLDAGHPAEPHVYVSLLAAHPGHQRGGRGRALLTAAIAEAERRGVATYLDTANPANLPYYGSFGFAVTGEGRLPRGAPLWYLLRP